MIDAANHPADRGMPGPGGAQAVTSPRRRPILGSLSRHALLIAVSVIFLFPNGRGIVRHGRAMVGQ